MEDKKLEFFKLDEIDRKVLVWLLSHVPQKSLLAWIDYIAEEYRLHKSTSINTQTLLKEIEQEEFD
jgi:type II secretory pathway component PulM